MTKIEAIRKLMQDYNGVATWEIIYNEIERYYPKAKKASDWKAGLRGVLYRDIGKSIKKIDEGTFALIDYDIKKLLPYTTEDDFASEKEVFTKVRLLQSRFRNDLLSELKICPITLVSDKRLLLASHIKPWCLSNSLEKVDTNNGFILSPLYDSLFDKGLITFSEYKEILISPSLEVNTIGKLSVREGIIDELPIRGREEYLEFHRNKIFIASG